MHKEALILFHLKTLHRYVEAQDQTLLKSRFVALQRYQAKAFEIQKLTEEKFQDGFLRDIFVSTLGYTFQPDTSYNLSREEKNEQDAKKADGAIIIDGHIVALIELKDLSTKDLDRPKTREGQSAVEQLFGYVTSHNHARYGIVSNFNELRFYFDKKIEYRRFDLFSMEFEEFKVFHLLLSFESIADNLPIKIKEESDKADKEVSNQLYRDYALFRRELFDNIRTNNSHIDSVNLLRLTQKLVDRIVFILFAEDTTLLPKNTIRSIREHYHNDIVGKSMYDYYKIYFTAINDGNSKLNITRYNGGLFSVDAELDELKIDENVLDIPAQKLSSYNFDSEVSVNILGHIFEQSLTDLEELAAVLEGQNFDAKKTKRKKDGVFYTPEYITRYIVENTLGRLCTDKRQQLALDVEVIPPVNFKKLSKIEQTTLDNLKTYRTWLLELKICDPACGSGAFLNQALEFLIREHKNIDKYRRLYENEALTLYDIETNILEHNLYGVDINEDAVEIARLSLWLRTAQKGRTLTNLSDKIKCGNSLISDKSIAENAFVWEEEFPEVFAQGGFDVVVGNPPYVRQEMLSQEAKSHFASNYVTYHGMADLYIFFVERGYSLLRKGGKFSYIFPNKWMRAGYGKPLRTFLMDKCIDEVIDFGDLPVFEEATTYPLILTMSQGEAQETFNTLELKSLDFGDLGTFVAENAQTVAMSGLSAEGFSMGGENAELLEKLKQNSITLSEYVGGEAYYGIKTGLTEAFMINESTTKVLITADSKSIEVIKPFLAGRDVKRYEMPKAEKYLILFPKGSTRQRSGFTAENEAWEWLKQTYPAIAQWFEPFAEKGRKRTDKGEFWWELRACAYYGEFEKPKIMYQKFQVKPAFVYDKSGIYCNDSMWILPKDDKVLLAILNSKIGWFLISSYCTSIQNGYQLIWKYLEQIPIPAMISAEQRTEIEKLVDAQLELVAKLSNLQNEFKSYLSSVLGVVKIPAKLDTPEKMSFDEFQSALLKLKVDMKDLSIFRSTKQLYEEMIALQKEIDRVDGEIDKVVCELYCLSIDEINIVTTI